MYLGIGATRITWLALLQALPICIQLAKIFLIACSGATESEPGMW
jgi:hypothetical protein